MQQCNHCKQLQPFMRICETPMAALNMASCTILSCGKVTNYAIHMQELQHRVIMVLQVKRQPPAEFEAQRAVAADIPGRHPAEQAAWLRDSWHACSGASPLETEALSGAGPCPSCSA